MPIDKKCNINCLLYQPVKGKQPQQLLMVEGVQIDSCIFRHVMPLSRGEYEHRINSSMQVTKTICYNMNKKITNPRTSNPKSKRVTL